ncbi:hypothetical protein THRCLA_07958 [Thraustotheca clavata]|uniref:Xylose isomerase-like TIM barrel domain-containing protein n=1 Tax=Thraustotheca clavata TaxID=74557 RepID=A0A1V9ZBF5_9STRA|nr:hypothetical protein THRCLA_07958 [Thraustotheca clavata]
MKLQVFRHLWGINPSKDIKTNLRVVKVLKELGYAGVEASLSAIQAHGGSAFLQELIDHDMKLIVGIYSGWTDYEPNAWENKSVSAHLKQFEDEINQAHELLLKPVMLNAHAGADHWNDATCHEFFKAASNIQHDIPIAHETHRGRVLWNPWRTLDMLEAYPHLKLTMDFSHWVVCAERHLDTEWDEEWLNKVIPHVLHIHGRIGTDEAPQVTDPQDPHVQGSVQRFDNLWSKIWTHQAKTGKEISTFTPEYGPSPYTQMAPFTGAPLSNVWDVCNRETKRQQLRFQDFISTTK